MLLIIDTTRTNDNCKKQQIQRKSETKEQDKQATNPTKGDTKENEINHHPLMTIYRYDLLNPLTLTFFAP